MSCCSTDKMKNGIRILCISFLILMITATNGRGHDGIRGSDAITNINAIPELRFEETVHQVSSHDKTGGNEDGGREEAGVESYLYMQNREYFIFDEIGPGCIYRIWYTDLRGGWIKFYFDGESVPRIEMTLDDFFSGNSAPFIFPIAGDDDVSSGGHYVYFPICYEKSLKVSLTVMPRYYNITYKRYANATGLETFRGDEDISDMLSLLSSAGEPLFSLTNAITISDTFSLQQNEQKIFLIENPGTIYSLNIKRLQPELNPNFIEFSDNIWIKMKWDWHPYYHVDAPFTPFFGGGVGQFPCKSLFIGSDAQTKSYYSYFPMPFDQRAEIVFENRNAAGTDDISIEIKYLPDVPSGLGKTTGYFRTEYRQGLTVNGQDFILLEIEGSGNVVGCVMDMRGQLRPSYLEGDERIYIDGSRTPQLYGTGTEDFFNGGYYFINGNFTLPFHGATFGERYKSLRMICNRLFVSDVLNFNSEITFGIEHGFVNDVSADYKTLVYWYGIDNPTLILNDLVELGDHADEKKHFYQMTGTAYSYHKGASYEGDRDDAGISDTGYSLKGKADFNVSIHPDNNGIRLRRRLDYSVGHQKADVYVNDQFVGVWYDAGRNTSKSWRDSEFQIPGAFTVGKNSLKFTIDATPYGREWTAFKYWIFSYKSIVQPSLELDAEEMTVFLPKGQMASRSFSVSNNGDGDLYIEFRNSQQRVENSVLITGWGDESVTQPYHDEFVQKLIEQGYTVTKQPAPPVDLTPYDLVILIGSRGTPRVVDANQIDAYVAAGGHLIIFEGMVYFGLFPTGANSNPISSISAKRNWAQAANVSGPEHPVVEGLPDAFNFIGYTSIIQLKAGASTLLRWENNDPFLVLYRYGSGHAAYINHFYAWDGATWHDDLTSGQQLMLQLADYFCRGVPSDWYRVVPQNISIPPLGTHMFDVYFDASDEEMVPGQYSANIQLLSNDPKFSYFQMPVKLNVGTTFITDVPSDSTQQVIFGDTDVRIRFASSDESFQTRVTRYDVAPEVPDSVIVLDKFWNIETHNSLFYTLAVTYNDSDLIGPDITESDLVFAVLLENGWLGMPTYIDEHNNLATAGISFSGSREIALGRFEVKHYPSRASDKLASLQNDVPRSFKLMQNYPNPFNQSCLITYTLPQTVHVSLDVYDILGRHVANLENNEQKPGVYRVSWDGKDDSDVLVPSGVYIVFLRTNGYKKNIKVVLIK